MELSSDAVARALKQLGEGGMLCPFCGEALGDVTYQAFDLKDEGLRGD